MVMYHIVDTTNDPVVTTYMECIGKACSEDNNGYDHIAFKSKPEKKDVLINDSILSAFYYMTQNYKNNIVWIQGTVPEESYMRNHSRLRVRVLSIIEKYVLRRANYILFVSEEMRRHYEEKYGISFENRCFIMPCFNEIKIVPEAFESSQKYEENSFVYVGSLSKWQCFDETALLVSKIQKMCVEPIRFDVYTRDVKAAEIILKRYNIQNSRVCYVEANELKGCILTNKYGFVLRQDEVVNRVATPTKFSNYISCGIIPIYSSCLKSFAQEDRKIGLGIVVDIENLDEAAATIVSSMSAVADKARIEKKCKTFFLDYYNAEKYIDKMKLELQRIMWRE